MLFSVLALAAVASARSVLYPRQSTPLPSTFKWTSTPAIVYPKNDTRNVASVKDPSVIYYDDAYHVFASISANEDYNLIYFNVTDWDKANEADFFYLDQSGIGTGYRAAPQVFWFEPQKLWYLVYQNGNAAYSTNPDIKDPAGWTAPKTFYADTPALIAEGLITPEQGYWVDMWVICNDVDCFLFSSDDNGRLYRSVTKIEDFPEGISEPVIAKQDAKYDLFEASMIYETGNSSYLLIVECIGTGESPGGLRYFRSWTSHAIDGNWTELAATQEHPFLGEVNVDFPEGRWTDSISHGEIIRTEVDQRLRIPTSGLQFLYQGIDPAPSNGSYNSLPWRLALATQVEDEE